MMVSRTTIKFFYSLFVRGNKVQWRSPRDKVELTGNMTSLQTVRLRRPACLSTLAEQLISRQELSKH